MITVLVADDHAVVRFGLTMLLHATPDIRVVGEASDGVEAVELTADLRPDIVLMDLSMPHLDGTQAIRLIVAAGGSSRVVALTSFCDRDRIMSTLDAGAVGYVLKDCAPEEIVRAVRDAAAGMAPLDPKVAQVLISARYAPARDAAGADLTAREREVLCRLAKGCSNRQIAQDLGISEATVKAHLTQVFHNLGVTDRTQAALWAQRRGLDAEPAQQAQFA